MRARLFLPILGLAAFLLSGCGGLSTHQTARLLDPGQGAWVGGFGLGSTKSCSDDDTLAFSNNCVLMLDPYFGYRGSASTPQHPGFAEMGIKFSGVPFVGGTILLDVRGQILKGPIYQTWDLGLHVFPCFWSKQGEGEDAPVNCGENPFGGGAYLGTTVGTEWFSVGAKYGVGGNTWDGLQLLPGVFGNLLIGPRGFKVIPSADVYFFQWPLESRPSLRVLVGLGFQGVF